MSRPSSDPGARHRRCELEGCNGRATPDSPHCHWHRDETLRSAFVARKRAEASPPEPGRPETGPRCALPSCNGIAVRGSEHCRHHQDEARRRWTERREDFLVRPESLTRLRDIVALHPGQAADAILREKIMIDALRQHLMDAYELVSGRRQMTDNTFIRLWLDASRSYTDLVRLEVQLEQGQSVVDLLGGVHLRSADEPDVYDAVQCGLPGFGPAALPEPAPPLERPRPEAPVEGVPAGGGGLDRQGSG